MGILGIRTLLCALFHGLFKFSWEQKGMGKQLQSIGFQASATARKRKNPEDFLLCNVVP